MLQGERQKQLLQQLRIQQSYFLLGRVGTGAVEFQVMLNKYQHRSSQWFHDSLSGRFFLQNTTDQPDPVCNLHKEPGQKYFAARLDFDHLMQNLPQQQ